MTGYEQYRHIARTAIENAGGAPLLVNEDSSAMPSTPRNACLDAVESSDAFLIIVGARGGFLAPSGKTVVEEEFDHALKMNKPVLAFVEEGEHDEDARKLVAQIEAYATGLFRATFNTTEDLSSSIERAVRVQVGRFKIPLTIPSSIQELLTRENREMEQPSARIVLAPVRREEFIDPRTFDRDGLANRLIDAAHGQSVQLLSYEHSTKHQLEGEWLIVQSRTTGRQGGLSAQFQISEKGWVLIEATVPEPQAHDQHGFSSSFVMAQEKLSNTLHRSIDFARAIFEMIDRFGRAQSVLFNAALFGLGQRVIEVNPQPRNSYTLNSWGNAVDPVSSYSEPREFSRAALIDPTDEIDRAVYLIVRNSKGSQ